jgi:hypothetical protein
MTVNHILLLKYACVRLYVWLHACVRNLGRAGIYLTGIVVFMLSIVMAHKVNVHL